MSTPPSDDELWQAVVEAKREMHRRQADFHHKAGSRPDILKAALAAGSGPWQRGAALDFLTELSDDVPALLGDLVGLCLSHGWALAARQAIDSIPHDELLPLLEPLVMERLGSADDDEYRRLAELLAHVQAWELLSRLVGRALDTDDPDTHEVAEDFTEWHGPMWLCKPNL
ncbi:hypothetical protein [Streptomyces sp. NPDC056361]|uniref:hypothetical protein n=1 Tax=Streptomyces sp. NPDC056361 TaxID=3345795 RepID=UPI0035D53F62